MTKRRSAQAVGAWSRHQGAHSPGTKCPDVDETEEGLEEYFEGTPAQNHEDFMKELAEAKDVDCLVFECPICVEKSSCLHVGDNKNCEFGHPECECLRASDRAKAKGLKYTGHCKACK